MASIEPYKYDPELVTLLEAVANGKIKDPVASLKICRDMFQEHIKAMRKFQENLTDEIIDLATKICEANKLIQYYEENNDRSV